jgi:hypothetical protein
MFSALICIAGNYVANPRGYPKKFAYFKIIVISSSRNPRE